MNFKVTVEADYIFFNSATKWKTNMLGETQFCFNGNNETIMSQRHLNNTALDGQIKPSNNVSLE